MINPEFMKKLFELNEQFHEEQSKVPIEVKIKRLVEMQKIAINIKKSIGREITERERVWQIPEL